MTGRRYLVLSDAHFGTPESSINDPRAAEALTNYVVSRAPWEEVVLTGDLLDVNLSTFTRSIEGGKYPDLARPLFGFRQFVRGLYAARGKKAGGAGEPLSRKWVYVPGNHDYKVWDMLATRVVCEDVLLAGKSMGSIPTPLRAHTWQGEQSFFAGIFREFGATDLVWVSYPNHVVSFGSYGTMLLTHGHYLDSTQTWRNDLATEVYREEPGSEDKAIRRVIIETAQYQTIANAVSFTRRTRRFVNDVVGPDGLMNKMGRLWIRLGAWVLRLVFRPDGTRGEAISAKTLRNIETYVEYFRPGAARPKWFVFGHTHHQDASRTPNHAISVHNVGSFYPAGDTLLTFLEVEVEDGREPVIVPMCLDRTFTVRRA